MEEDYYKQQNNNLKKQIIIDTEWSDELFGKTKSEQLEEKKSLLLKNKGGVSWLLTKGDIKFIKKLNNKKVEMLYISALGVTMIFVLGVIYYYGVVAN